MITLSFVLLISNATRELIIIVNTIIVLSIINCKKEGNPKLNNVAATGIRNL